MDYPLYISYFQRVRYMPRTMVPVSTAHWQPRWWCHQFDKRGVINGLTIPLLSPNIDCGCPCGGTPPCKFLTDYYNSLPPFSQVKEYLDSIHQQTSDYYGTSTSICLLVYERPDNPCSERLVLIQYFKENGVDLIEYDPRI